ncbi:NAD(P)-binding protein [Coprinopsis marcescibilis]|uniref:NAD(P)-binding protein n=1 Tax=Coprinopsis marcescibilis TaxID=230819 RepID=A0A5C3LAY4_COPMA|nr:NAD(P)-binding protein [Coprinopsis marcescibilis]
MPKLAAVRSANIRAASVLKANPPVAVVVGGTSGIGQGMTEAFARFTNGNAHIVIVGRNRQSAETILSQLPKPTDSSSWSHEFVQCDATLMKNVQKASQEILQRHSKINFLIMSPGYSTTEGRTETEEGIDRKLAVHYYARWKFIDQLLPALKNANNSGEESKVMSVFAAGAGGEINVDDLGLVKTFSLKNAALQAPTYNDLMAEEYASRNPGLTFIHSIPGFVNTNLASNSPSASIRAFAFLMDIMSPLITTQDECGEYMWNGVFQHTSGVFRTDSHGENMHNKRYYGNEDQRRRLWEHTSKVTNVPL